MMTKIRRLWQSVASWTGHILTSTWGRRLRIGAAVVIVSLAGVA